MGSVRGGLDPFGPSLRAPKSKSLGVNNQVNAFLQDFELLTRFVMTMRLLFDPSLRAAPVDDPKVKHQMSVLK